MELQHFSHTHPLLFNQELSHEIDDKSNCAGCGELLSGPNFSCLGCKFYLHKQCTEAPSQMNHPLRPDYPLKLLKEHPYSGRCVCDFCNKTCENFVYHCSFTRQLDLHIKCAFVSCKIADKRIEELQHIPRVDPLVSTESCNNEELKKAECFACWKPLLDSVFLSSDCGFYLHAKCLHLIAEINHFFHPQHPLVLLFNSECLPCNICQKTQLGGLVYCCPSCKFVLHIHCASLPTEMSQFYHRKHPLILQFVNEPLPCQMCQELIHLKEAAYFCSICKIAVHIGCPDESPSVKNIVHHDHRFTLVRGYLSFVCDACGAPGNYIPYICLTCNLIVHKKCISLPRIIRFHRHHHRLFHTYFLPHESETLVCSYCHEVVKTAHGSYFCSMCNYFVHVNCALKEKEFFREVDQTEEDEVMDIASYSRVSATCIKHFSHDHNLSLREDVKDEMQCDGCSLLISTHYYFCEQCDFFLHESCAELPLKKHVWYHLDQKLLRLALIGIFECSYCTRETSGFAYICDECGDNYCIRCISISDNPKCKGHKHPLPYYIPYEGICNACGSFDDRMFRCKTCDFNVDKRCIRLPLKVRHKSDDHLYTLTYHDSDYPGRHYCDICEEERNPNYWFYHYSICDNSAHPDCVIGKYSYIKLGSIYTKGDHPHPLTFVQKVHYYPECDRCGKHCFNLALECKEVGCNYIAHWECIKPPQL